MPDGVVRFETANALALPYRDDEFDAATVGFGARNFSDLEAGLREMARVVRPGGRVVVLEITTPQRPPLSTFFRLWFDRAVPALGRLAGDPQAYSYLPSSVKRFPGPAELAAAMSRCGLTEIRYRDHGRRDHRAARGGGATMNAVQAVVEAGGAEISRLMLRVEQRMSELTSGHGPLLGTHAGATIAAGGKRLRPLLVCLAAGVPAPETDGLVRAAVAVELVHGATLVHDDVLDGASLRRGRPTVVALGGRRLATATGDLLFSRAFAELAAGGSLEAVRILSAASSELASGELMQRSDAWDTSVGVDRYLERCRLKTAVLFRAACELGALEGAGDRLLLGSFGERIGVAFQLLDDVLDVSGPPERTGKPRGADLLDGTVTLPLIVARERDQALASVDLRALRGAEEAAEVCERITATGALEVVRARAMELVTAAKALLQALTERQQAALEMVADGVVERYA